MKKMMISALAIAALCVCSGSAFADDQTTQNQNDVAKAQADVNKGQADAKGDPTDYFRIGMTIDLGFPSGGAIGVQERLPYLPWFKFSEALTYTLAPGFRGSLLVDPIAFPIAPVLNADIGWQSRFNIPGFNNPPTVQWSYETIGGGLALGGRDSCRFLLLAGMTHFDGTVGNIEGRLPNTPGLSLDNPTIHAWTPSARLGVEFLF